MRKFLLLIALMVSGFGIVSAQNEITIGNGTSSDYNAPFNNYYKHSWNETIYQKGDIGGAGTITSVSYERASASSYTTQTIKIYMGETTRSSISSTTDWTPANQLTLVYSGNNITIGDSAWETFTLNTPFEYSGENNLVVVVAKTASSYTNSLKWYYTNSSNGSNVTMYRQNDSSTSYASHPSGNTGTRQTYAANIKLGGDFSTSEQPLTIGDSKVIAYDGYSLKYTVTSIEPAECEVVCSTSPSVKTSITIPSVVSVLGNDVSVTSIGECAFDLDVLGTYNIVEVKMPNTITAIKGSAFSHCYDLKKIEIPSSVTTIEEYAFKTAINLESIIVEDGNTVFDSRNNCNAIIETETNTLIAGCKNSVIPNTVKSIAASAFSCQYNLTNIVFEENSQLTSIGTFAFYQCDISSLEIPSSVTCIEDYAFSSCSKLTDIYCYAESVPATANDVFDYCYKLTKIYVPAKSVATYKASSPWNNYTIEALPIAIGDNTTIAYDGYSLKYTITSLEPAECEVECHTAPTTATALNIPSSVNISGINYDVTSIVAHGFEGNGFFRGELIIPNTVRMIGEYAFARTCMTDIEIPNSVTYIGDCAFENITNECIFYDIDCEVRITIFDNITHMGEEVFGNNAISEYVFSEGTKSIGDNHYNYTGADKIIFPSSVEYIGENSIYCSNTIVCYAEEVPETHVTSFGNPSFIYVPEGSVEAYRAAEPWKNYNITKIYPYVIGDYAIVDYNGYSLKYTITNVEPAECEVVCNSFPTVPTAITIPSSVNIKGGEFAVTSTGEWAFSERDLSNNTTITSIELPNTVKSLGQISFRRCSGLQSVTFGENSQLTTIGNSAFSNCTGLTSINIPNGVTTIGWDAFSDCTGLTSINIPNGVTTIGGDAFSDCTGLTSINIPNGVTTIGWGAFRNCTSLTSINIPNGVTSIGERTFMDCTSLSSVIFEENSQLTTISDAFKNCTSLTSIEIPYGVSGIYSTFHNCTSLESVVIPETVNEMRSCFNNCSSLKTIICYAEQIPNSDSGIFQGVNENLKIYVPVVSVQQYEEDEFWGVFEIIGMGELPEGTSLIKDYGGYSLEFTVTSIDSAECEVTCSSMPVSETTLTIPSNVKIGNTFFDVTAIGYEAFDGNGSQYFVGDLVLPNTVREIKAWAFSNCTGFTSLTLSENLEIIGSLAFYGCTGLTGSLVIPNKVTLIKHEAFRNSINLNGSLTMSDNIEVIEYYAFVGCSFTGTLVIPASLKEIGAEALPCNFDNYVVYSATPAQSERTNTPDHFPDNSIVYVPSVSLSLYETEWGNKGYYSGNNYEFIGMPTYTSNGWVGANGTTPIETPSSEEYVAVNADMTIAENEIFHANTLGLTENGSLTIKDGGKLIANKVIGEVTVEKEIAGYQQSESKWYTIASPLKGETDLSASSVNNIFNNQYDLYRYDEATYTWQNYKNSANNGFTTLESGRGYLYANAEDVTLEFTGAVNTDDVTYNLTAQGEKLNGFHLIGNPFTHDIYMNQFETIERHEIVTVKSPVVVFKLQDSYGDGWNGNKLNVSFSDGTSSKTYTISSGNSSATYSVELAAGVEVTVKWTKGSYSDECSFVIEYEEGETIFSKESGSLSNVSNATQLCKFTTKEIVKTEVTETVIPNMLVNGYYTLNGDGAWEANPMSKEDAIKPMQGILVKTLQEGELTISRQQSRNRQQDNKSTRQQALQINVANAKYSDKAFVVFDNGIGLDKINHENENIPLLYIPVDGTDYAIAMMDMNVNEIPVNFETNVMGEYTISLRQENCEFEELYLLDKETNTTVNILAEDYTFIATSSDNPERFVLIKENGQQTTDNSHFAYVNNGDIVIYDIEGNGDIQIFDAMGRCVYNGNCSIDAIHRVPMGGFSTGVYMIQKADESGVKVQKVIID